MKASSLVLLVCIGYAHVNGLRLKTVRKDEIDDTMLDFDAASKEDMDLYQAEDEDPADDAVDDRDLLNKREVTVLTGSSKYELCEDARVFKVSAGDWKSWGFDGRLTNSNWCKMYRPDQPGTSWKNQYSMYCFQGTTDFKCFDSSSWSDCSRLSHFDSKVEYTPKAFPDTVDDWEWDLLPYDKNFYCGPKATKMSDADCTSPKNKKGCYASPQPQETPWLEWLNRRQSFYANPSLKEKWVNPTSFEIGLTRWNPWSHEQEVYPYDVFKSLHDLVKEKYGPFQSGIETYGSKNLGDAGTPYSDHIWKDQSKIKKQYEANSCLGPRPSDSCVSNTAYCWGGRLPKVWKKCGSEGGGSNSGDCGKWETVVPSRRRGAAGAGEKEFIIKDSWRLDNPAGTYDKHTFKGVTIPQGGSCIDVMSDYEVCYVAPVGMNKGTDTDDGWSWITLGYDVRAGCFTQETGNPWTEAYLQDPIRNAMKATYEPARRLFMQRYTFWCLYAGWKNNKQQQIARSGNNYGRPYPGCDFGNVDMSKTTDIAVDFSPINYVE